MLNFAYKGISKGKYVEGEIEAINNSEAAYKLKEQKVIITKLAQAKKKVVAKKKEPLNFSFGTGVKTKEILIFAKQFATMQRAGLPILTSLDLLISQTTGPALKKIIIQIKKDLESGNALSACFEKHPKIFDVVTVNLIKAGEASGKLDIFLERIVESLEKREKIKAQIKSALFYPAVLLTVALLVTTFMLIKVVPTFVEMYTNMGLADKLPSATKVILSASDFIRAKGFMLLLFIIATLWFVFRKIVWIIVPISSCFFSVLIMTGLLGLLGWKVTVISSNFIALMLILTMAMNIHMSTRFLQLKKNNPDLKNSEIILMTTSKMFWPIIYTVLTTICAFLSLIFSEIKPIIDFGWMMTLGLITSFNNYQRTK